MRRSVGRNGALRSRAPGRIARENALRGGAAARVANGDPERESQILAPRPPPRRLLSADRSATDEQADALGTRREAAAGKQGGRTVEIQRLIGRSLRAAVDLEALGERQITVDCDVIQADGGTRTAAITGAWVALHDCFAWMRTRSIISVDPLRDHVAAVSCGLYKGTAVLDLDYAEDSAAEADSNFVMTGAGGIVEVQGTAETVAFSQESFDQLMSLAKKGIGELVALQKLTVS